MGEIISWDRAQQVGSVQYRLVYRTGEPVTFRDDTAGAELQGVIRSIDKMLKNGVEYDLIQIECSGSNYAVTKHDLVRTINVELLP